MLLDHPSDGPAAIRTQFGAIFVSLELSRSNWLVTSLSPGKGEKMSKHSVPAGDTAELTKLFAELSATTILGCSGLLRFVRNDENHRPCV